MIGKCASQIVEGRTAWVFGEQAASGISRSRPTPNEPSRVCIPLIDLQTSNAFPDPARRSLSRRRIPGFFYERGDIGVQGLQRRLVRVDHVARRVEVHFDVVLQRL